jgi:hypothetical protein
MALFYDSGNGYKSITLAKNDMGCDAYLCCPGPSLKLINPDTIKGKGRKVFSINTTYPFVKPDIWLGMDKIECYDRNILYEPFMKVFRGPLIPQMFFEGKSVTKFQDTYWLGIDKPEKNKSLFDYREASTRFVWHKSTLMVAIHMMVWMGAKNIYFIGCDMGGKEDYYKGNILNDDQRKYNRNLYRLQVDHLKKIVEEGKKHGINFYSATPDSPINNFMEYYSVDEMIQRSEEKTKFKEENAIKHVLDVSKPTTIVTTYKEGSDFDESYVYKLKESVEKYLPKDSDFICLTNSTKLEGVKKMMMQNDWSHDFNRLELFEHFTNKRTLYIDLSCLIKKDMPRLTLFNEFTMLEDFTNKDLRSSAVMGWTGNHSYLLNKFKENPDEYIKQYTDPNNVFEGGKWKGGYVDKFIQDNVKKIKTWNKNLISSYKFSSKNWVDNSIIVNYHGKPKQNDVNWEIYRPELKEESKVETQNIESSKDIKKILHITNWAIWGGVQSVTLSISKELNEYKHYVFSINSKGTKKDCVNNFKNNKISFQTFDGVITKEDVDKINPDLIFLHSTRKLHLKNCDNWLKNYKTVRVHHGWNLGPLDVDLNWFVSDFVYSKLNYEISEHFILPPVTYIKDYLEVERPERESVVGRIQSQTHIGGKPFPQKFYDLMKKLNTKQFVVGPEDSSIDGIIKHGNIEAGKMKEYLKEVDVFVIWQDKIETWCLVATEANLSGIPVVARRMNDGLTEQLEKSKGGILVDTEEEFLNAVNEFINNKELRNKVATRGKEWLVENVNTKLLRGYLNDFLNG